MDDGVQGALLFQWLAEVQLVEDNEVKRSYFSGNPLGKLPWQTSMMNCENRFSVKTTPPSSQQYRLFTFFNLDLEWTVAWVQQTVYIKLFSQKIAYVLWNCNALLEAWCILWIVLSLLIPTFVDLQRAKQIHQGEGGLTFTFYSLWIKPYSLWTTLVCIMWKSLIIAL